MASNRHHVTVEHLHHLTASTGPVDHGATALVDTNDGIRIVAPDQVLRPGSGVRRLLMTSTDLIENADHAGLTMSAYLRASAGRIAAELNALIETEPATA